MRHILLAVLAFAATNISQAKTITVDDNSPADFTNIQAAINDANDGDIVIVRPGQYFGDGNRDIRFLGKAITVQSIDPNDPCIVSATVINCSGNQFENHRGFTFDNNEGPNSILDGLTITGGYGSYVKLLNFQGPGAYAGGGILCINSSPTITHCRIRGNTVESGIALGGGICYWGGGPAISHCIISNNNANGSSLYLFPFSSISGGGIFGNGEGIISDCVISKNTAIMSGGGINCADSVVLNCTIEENKVLGYETSSPSYPPGLQPGPQYNAFGGGIYCDGNIVINNCVIRKNIATAGGLLSQGGKAFAARGGGICVRASNPLSTAAITNSVISENSIEGGQGRGLLGTSPIWRIIYGYGGDGLGGGIYYDPCGTVSIANCLFVANISKGGRRGSMDYPDGNAFGGGIYCGRGTVTGCTFAANEAMAGAGIYGYPVVSNCILWDVVEQNSIPVSEIHGRTTVQYSNIRNGYPGIGNIDNDPCFVRPGYWLEVNIMPPWNPPVPLPPYPPNEPTLIWVEGNYRLLLDSPCIDSGDPNYTSGPNETDLDGNRRVVAGRIDMGAYEFPNAVPVANAGPNQVAYAWIDGIADVTLDGSVSYDADGDELTYLWRWTIDSNEYEANTVNPTIELPIGQYMIELVVNDGIEDSEPNQVSITVTGPIKGSLWVTPQTINRRCEQRNIMAMLRLPQGIAKDQIDSNSPLMLYPGEIEAVNQYVFPFNANGARNLCIFAFFDRDAVLEAIGGNGPVQVYVVGQLKTGQYFYGSDTTKIINPGRWPRWGNMRDWFRNRNWNHACQGKKR